MSGFVFVVLHDTNANTPVIVLTGTPRRRRRTREQRRRRSARRQLEAFLRASLPLAILLRLLLATCFLLGFGVEGRRVLTVRGAEASDELATEVFVFDARRSGLRETFDGVERRHAFLRAEI